MRVIPVMDLKKGVVVRGLGGRRHEYRPILSRLTGSSAPADVASAFRDQLGLTEFYLADLDAIAGGEPAFGIYASIRQLGCRLWVDAGVREPDGAVALAAAGVERIVVGLETVRGPEVLEDCGRMTGADRLVFSLDLRDGMPLGRLEKWHTRDARTIAERAISAGVRHLIVLDLARVGGGRGTGTEDLCTRLAAAHPEVEIVAGGGICGIDDLRRLQRAGLGGALVASALHDGRLGKNDLGEGAPR
jgi:phosphoribosylformimino-5-aminoimidazole carboxamide ribotide isomerase